MSNRIRLGEEMTLPVMVAEDQEANFRCRIYRRYWRGFVFYGGGAMVKIIVGV